MNGNDDNKFGVGRFSNRKNTRNKRTNWTENSGNYSTNVMSNDRSTILIRPYNQGETASFDEKSSKQLKVASVIDSEVQEETEQDRLSEYSDEREARLKQEHKSALK